MDDLNFRISSELKNILGRDLITDDNIAVLELVKNSYDAHATKVEMTFEDDKLVISDNGKGMTKDDLINKWLFVGFSAKRDNTEDASYRSKFNRHYAGAKGIGRLSCDRLSRYVKLTSKSSQSPTTEVLYVDWREFENSQRNEFDNIKVKHESLNSIPQFPLNSTTGTIIELIDLHRVWEKADILNLRSSLEKMINPFNGADDFQIEIKVPSLADEDNQIKKELRECNYNELSDKDKVNYAQKEITIVNGIIQNTISDILKLKTTQIESYINDGIIHTRILDRGELMYEIEEQNTYSKLNNASISIYFLNRAAKYNFSLKMGISPVNYGNIFLFRNGIRIWPYGEPDDDSWGLNKRSQQGYNRTLGTRDLFGRVDVETENLNDFKEVSSRDGGLIKNDSTDQLYSYFSTTHRRLERYVVGVLWGEGFLRNDYFKDKGIALDTRRKLQEQDKDSANAQAVYDNIGSKVDFLQLIKNLVNDPSIKVIHYNEKLADIVNDTSAKDIIRENLYEDLRKIAEKTHDAALINQIQQYHQQIEELRREKEEAERKAEEERARAAEETRKREEEQKKREKAEKERDAQKQSNLYLSATRNTTQEVQDIMHSISINANELKELIADFPSLIEKDDKKNIYEKLYEEGFFVNRIHQLSKLITKADINNLKNKTRVDIREYLTEYVKNFRESLSITAHSNGNWPVWKIMSLLDLSIVMDNLISNSKKASADSILLSFNSEGRTVILDFSDNGDGLDEKLYSAESLFYEGVTTRDGGSGIGLHTVKYTMENELNGTISFVGNGQHGMKGATFRLVFN